MPTAAAIPTNTEPCGVLIVDKPAGMTSHDVVGRVRRLFGTRRVGHTGTLDPMATGVLVVLLGRAAKAAEYLTCDKKHYLATLRLGLTTDTEDITGTVLSSSDARPAPGTVEKAVASFLGESRQTPPMYSALKVNGQKLYDLARRGVTVERESRPITVTRLDCRQLSESDYELDVECSAGTYIRTLCADIGAALGCGGVMAALRRTEAGGFALSQAHTLDELEALPPEERVHMLLPVESLFAALPAVSMPPFYEKLCRDGCAVATHKLKCSLPRGSRVRMLSNDGIFFALGEIVANADGEDALKTIKLFVL